MALASGVSAADAATWKLNGGGQLIGATNVIVGTKLYDVSFVSGDCLSARLCSRYDYDYLDVPSHTYKGGPTFSSYEEAERASLALLDQVFVGKFDLDPWATVLDNYIVLTNPPMGIYTLYSQDYDYGYLQNLFMVHTVNRAGDQEDTVGFNTGRWWFEPDIFGEYAYWAVWSVSDTPYTPAVSNVPLPAGGMLLLTGLAVMAGCWRLSRSC